MAPSRENSNVSLPSGTISGNYIVPIVRVENKPESDWSWKAELEASALHYARLRDSDAVVQDLQGHLDATIRAAQPLLEKIVWAFCSRGSFGKLASERFAQSELCDFARPGILEALARWSPEGGAGFATYALSRVWGTLVEQLREQMPRNIFRPKKGADEPDRRILSIDAEPDYWRQESELARDEAALDLRQIDDADQVASLLATVREDDAQILSADHLREQSLSDVGTELGVGESQASKLLKAARHRLAETIASEIGGNSVEIESRLSGFRHTKNVAGEEIAGHEQGPEIQKSLPIWTQYFLGLNVALYHIPRNYLSYCYQSGMSVRASAERVGCSLRFAQSERRDSDRPIPELECRLYAWALEEKIPALDLQTMQMAVRLKESGGNQAAAADSLGITARTLRNWRVRVQAYLSQLY